MKTQTTKCQFQQNLHGSTTPTGSVQIEERRLYQERWLKYQEELIEQRSRTEVEKSTKKRNRSPRRSTISTTTSTAFASTTTTSTSTRRCRKILSRIGY
eukprot:6482529-Amphidinium_carterae.4